MAYSGEGIVHMKNFLKKKPVKLILGVLAVLIVVGLCMDTETPVINASDLRAEYGSTFSFSDFIEATDNRSDEVLVEAISSGIKGVTIKNDKKEITFDDPGEYEVEFSATDESGNQSTSVVKIDVVDTQAPKIDFIKDEVEIGYSQSVRVESEDDFLELKVDEKSAYSVKIVKVTNVENKDTEKLYELNESGSEIKFLKIGTYDLGIEIKDIFGNTTTDTVNVKVVDKTQPIIECKQTEIVLSDTDKTNDYLKELTAKDEIDGDITKNIKVDDSAVKYGEVGKYQIKASVADKSNNVCTKSFYVVIKDKTPPELTLSQATFSVQVNASAPNYKNGVKAVDRTDGDVTSSIVVDDSSVNYSAAGTYSVVYKITDSSGNTTTKNASVTVNAPVDVPVSSGAQVMITSTGSCYHTHKCGNGTYYWVSLDEALNRGLRACKKCY